MNTSHSNLTTEYSDAHALIGGDTWIQCRISRDCIVAMCGEWRICVTKSSVTIWLWDKSSEWRDGLWDNNERTEDEVMSGQADRPIHSIYPRDNRDSNIWGVINGQRFKDIERIFLPSNTSINEISEIFRFQVISRSVKSWRWRRCRRPSSLISAACCYRTIRLVLISHNRQDNIHRCSERCLRLLNGRIHLIPPSLHLLAYYSLNSGIEE